MVNEGQEYLFSAPWASIFPGLAILVTVLAFNFVGDGLRDALDPFLKGRM
jgi:ABC-type dipeptide/oligopeptide/nickel transport system permease subunit